MVAWDTAAQRLALDRPLLARERAALQGFPDAVASVPLKEVVAKRVFGNAMAVPVVGTVIGSLLRRLERHWGEMLPATLGDMVPFQAGEFLEPLRPIGFTCVTSSVTKYHWPEGGPRTAESQSLSPPSAQPSPSGPKELGIAELIRLQGPPTGMRKYVRLEWKNRTEVTELWYGAAPPSSVTAQYPTDAADPTEPSTPPPKRPRRETGTGSAGSGQQPSLAEVFARAPRPPLTEEALEAPHENTAPFFDSSQTVESLRRWLAED